MTAYAIYECKNSECNEKCIIRVNVIWDLTKTNENGECILFNLGYKPKFELLYTEGGD